MNIAHLLKSPSFGGIERQVLTLAQHLPTNYHTHFLSFAENGRCRPFLERARAAGFEAIELRENWPHLFRSAREVAHHLRQWKADVVCTSGYKPDLIGWVAARQVGIPVVAIAHGWTAATWKVRLNEILDRWVMRRLDRVVSVSAAQATKVRRARVREERMVTIPNALSRGAPAPADHEGRQTLENLLPRSFRVLVVGAGRLSPEKGFDLLIDAAARLVEAAPDMGFILFGEGALRDALSKQINASGLEDRFVLGGFRSDLDQLLPHADIFVLPSRTEGLPVVLLEALASGLAVVATAAGGVPEVIEDQVHGYLVPSGKAPVLAERVLSLYRDPGLRRRFGLAGRRRVATEFDSAQQSRRYQRLFEELLRA